MENIAISKEQARQFAYDWYDVIVRDIRKGEETEKQEDETRKGGNAA